MPTIIDILDSRLAKIKEKFSGYLGEDALGNGIYVLPVTQEEYKELKSIMSISMSTFPSETPSPDQYSGARLKVLSENPVEDFVEYYYKWMSALVQEKQQSRGMFICGYSIHNSPHGMPTVITVCPGFGSDAMALYQLRKDLSAPGY